ncbi:MAG: hypothetical protein KIS73_28225 [Enhydrobacter sp.]|jgi:hypothetical protein|nr:hypothetical protein [Enhydrobacter sp.]
MQKLLILQSFHRYVPTGEFRTVTKPGGGQERVELERKEVLVQSTTVEVGDELATDWIAKGLARTTGGASTGDTATAV